jgi:hypothetical protein
MKQFDTDTARDLVASMRDPWVPDEVIAATAECLALATDEIERLRMWKRRAMAAEALVARLDRHLLSTTLNIDV